MRLVKQQERKFKATGVDGVSISVLRENDTNGGAALVKMRKNSIFPLHHHPGWEQLYVVSGNVDIEGKSISAGDHLFTSAGEMHAVHANEDSELLVFFRERNRHGRVIP